MTQKKLIDPTNWQEFLSDFSVRNRGRRARFEIFEDGGNFSEESQEGYFESAAVDGRSIAVNRTYESDGETKTMHDAIPDTHGIEVQYDTDGSEDTVQFTNHNGDMTVLHFESKVDGDS